MKKKQIIFVVAAILIVLPLAMTLIAKIPWSSIFPAQSTSGQSQNPRDSLEYQEYRIMVVTGVAGSFFRDHISLVEQVDEEGKPYYIGKLDPELDTLLEPLADAYNADPSTTKPLTLDELRHSLTDGIVEATKIGTEEGAFFAFLRWCNTPADLVYTADIPGAGISVGDKAVVGITNYIHVLNRGKPDWFYKYPWE